MTIMLYRPDINDPVLTLIKDDPVRPNIPLEFRISETTEVWMLKQDDKVRAVVCIAYRDRVPVDCDELYLSPEHPTTVVFYTIWSYEPGAGRELLIAIAKQIKDSHPEVKRFVTLSPKTDLARKFHTKNGAVVFRENIDSINYEYLSVA
jgi:hypothetical protein